MTISKKVLRNKVFAWALSALFLVIYEGVLPGLGAAQIAPRSDDEQQAIDAYKRGSEAVVFILTKSITVDPFMAFSEVRQNEGSGSGTIVDAKRGIIVTNLHVIQDADKIEIVLADGKSHGARLVGYDAEYDLAVLQIREPPDHLTALEFGDSAALEVGQQVLAIGNPFGLERTLTRGIVSSLDRTVRGPKGQVMRGLVQIDAAINPGNSGGPLLDKAARLIGINSAILSQSGDSAGIGFAIPVNLIKNVLPELVATGKVLRPYVGWMLVDTNLGVLVKWIEPNGPASNAGVRAAHRPVHSGYYRGYALDYSRADRIIGINGQKVRTREEVDAAVRSTRQRQPIVVSIVRESEEIELTLKPVLK